MESFHLHGYLVKLFEISGAVPIVVSMKNDSTHFQNVPSRVVHPSSNLIFG